MAPLWGASDSDESKPKNLTTAEKKEVFANGSGWVREAGSALSGNNNTDADPELLVAISGLAVSLGAADVTEVEWITTEINLLDLLYQLELDTTKLLQLLVTQHLQLPMETKVLDQVVDHTPLSMPVDQVLMN